MILYKYLQSSRLDVLRNMQIRFTQPGDFNDPFEFRPRIREIASDKAVQKFLGENFERLVDEELAKYGAIAGPMANSGLKEALLGQKSALMELIRQLEPSAIQELTPALDSLLNLNVGILCLSEVRDSLLMWGHYAENHQGFVVGFDAESSFFAKRRSPTDEFGFLRRVDYSPHRPEVTLTDTSSNVWFQTKSEQWAYEKEWRIVRVLAEADKRVDRPPYPICLFGFDPDSVREIIVGMRASPSLEAEIRAVASQFSNVSLLRAKEGTGYDLKIVGI